MLKNQTVRKKTSAYLSVVGPSRGCFLRGLLPLGLVVLCLVLPGVSKADDTNGTWPVVSVQTIGNATESGSQSGAFTIQRTGDTSQALVVNYRLSGTVTNGVDYQRLSGTVTLSAGQSSATIGVMPVGNPAEGADKSVTVTLVAQNQPFTLVMLPDTQCYTHEYSGGTRDIFTAQTQWIVGHKDELNIAFVLHEGDVTEQNSAPDWTNGLASMSLLDGVVPYAITVGNHDGLYSNLSQTAPFNQFFPLSKFQNLPTFGGVFESNRMDNCYHLFSAGGVDWLLFSLEFGPRNVVLAWANQVATNYPNRRVIVLTHAHIYCDNTLHGSSSNQAYLPTSYGRENNGSDVWEKFIRHHANMGFVFNGHILNGGGAGRLVGVGDFGNQVFQMLADYQGYLLGGAGYLRIAQFFPDQDRMSVKTYSPYLDSWLTDTNNQFEYTNLGVFTNPGPGYLVDTQYASASLIITNDNVDLTPPGVCGFSYMGVPPVFKVIFNEPVEAVSAQTVTNYSIDNGICLTSATLLSDGRTVALAAASDLTPNTLYTLTVNHVKDCSRANNAMSTPVANTFTYSPIFLSDDFTDGLLQGWTVVDEGTITAPSWWLERFGRLMQISKIYGPNGSAADHRKGTCLYWNDPQALAWSNYTFSVTFNNSDNDGVGVLFRYQNPSNYYKVDLDSKKNFHKLFKMVGGVETILAAESGAYVSASNYVLRVETTNSQITVLLNGTVLFGGAITDSDLNVGTVALYSWDSQGVFFNTLRVTPLRRWPSITIQSPTNGAAFTQPNPVPVEVDAFDPDGSVQRVDLFNGTSILATWTNAPCLFQWTNLPTGNYTLTAQVVDSAGMTVVSTPVSFTVTPPPPKPVFIVQPASQNVNLGNPAVFLARAGGSPVNYQWQCNGVLMNGATNTFLVLNNVQSANAGSYTVMAANQWGSAISQPAILSVDSVIQSNDNAANPPSLCLPSLQILGSGVPLITVSVTNIIVVNIEWSSDLRTWAPLLTLTNDGGALCFADPDAVNHPQRFYRAVAQP